MQKQTIQHIKLALAGDLEVDDEVRRKVLSLLSGNHRRRLGTTQDACKILDNCHPITLRRYEKKGLLAGAAVRLSKRKLRWDLDIIEAYAQTGITSTNGEG